MKRTIFNRIVVGRTFFILFYVIILLFLNERIILHIKEFCISLIIPSTLDDFNRCCITLKNSVCRSVKYPEEIVIIISGIGNNNLSKYSIVVNEIRKCTNNLILFYRKMKYSASSNRNMGYSLSNCPIISFFDVDDIMSIYRIYVISKVFKENNHIDVLFHPSTRNYSELFTKNSLQYYHKYVVVNKYKQIYNRCKYTFHFDNRIYKCDVSNGFFITNGWPSIKRSIMHKIKFNVSLQSTEDLDFISRIVRNGYKVSLYRKPLGYYIKDNQCTI